MNLSFNAYLQQLLQEKTSLDRRSEDFVKELGEQFLGGTSLPLGGAETPTVAGRSPRTLVKYEPLKGKLLSPYVGGGAGGLRFGVRIRRSYDPIPDNSAVGVGLNNQATQGGATVIAKVKGTRKK